VTTPRTGPPRPDDSSDEFWSSRPAPRVVISPAPSGRPPSGPPSWWEQHRRRVGQIAVATAVTAVFVYAAIAIFVGVRALGDERSSRDAARADRDRSTARIADAEEQTAVLVTDLGVRVNQRDAAGDRATIYTTDLGVARGELTTAEQGLAYQTTRIGSFGTCIEGVNTTLAQIGGGDRGGASTTLASISLPCNVAVGATGGAAPAFAFDFPDPYVLRVGDVYFAYSTNAGAGDIQVATSPDLRQWTFVGNALGGLPAWAGPHRTWAPSVVPLRTGVGLLYTAYYTVRNGPTGPECISRAVSATPQGPFVDESTGPMICPAGADAIDPSPFVDDDGTPYLTWRGEGGMIYSQPLSSDGSALVGERRALIGVDQAWEGRVVEGPSLVHARDRYYLFYSGNEWNSRDYAVGYAVCDTPLGPCSKPNGGRLFTSFGTVIAPGGAEVFKAGDGTLWMAYHAYTEPSVGYPNSRRLHIAPVSITAGVPSVNPG
jgi:hypothetical protein